MNNKLYVGNLSWNTREDSLQEYFSQFGEVTDTFVATEKMSGRSKGFGFVTFANEEDASTAAQKANGAEVDGRQLKVDVARPMEERPARDENRSYSGAGRSSGGGNFRGGNSRGGNSRGGNSRGGDSRGGNSRW